MAQFTGAVGAKMVDMSQGIFGVFIGSASSHRDGGDFTVALQACPLDERIILRPPKEETSSVTNEN
jgi:hypothetical protein